MDEPASTRRRGERTRRLLDQLELQLEELEASASEDEIAAEMAAAKTQSVAAFTRQRPSRQPFPEHLPRERVVEPAPCACPACGGARLSKLGEDVTETLEVVPRQWKVIQHVREKFSCRDCEAISRRKVFELADLEQAATGRARRQTAKPISPLAVEAVQRIDALFAIEREINGLTPAERLAVRQARSAPLVAELESWMLQTRDKLSRGHDEAKAFSYMLRRWPSFTRFLEDGRICLTNNAAERALRGVALGRKAWLFCGSDRGGRRAAVLYSLIVTAKLNDVDPQAWLADVLARIAAHPAQDLDALLPWNWRPRQLAAQAA